MVKGPSEDSSTVAAPLSRPGEPGNEKRLLGLLRSRVCLVPTVRGWIVLGFSLALFLVIAVRGIYPFLAVNDPIRDGLLVVEGWLPDYQLGMAAEEFKRDHYEKIYVVGGPLEYGSYLSTYQNFAQLGAATLVKFGLDSNSVQAVSVPMVRKDRTYTSAVVLKRWLLAHGIQPTRIHLISNGPHARRSRLLYRKAVGQGVFVGVTSNPGRDYDPQHWWRSSAGVRTVTDEALAYLYARFLFFPPKPQSL